MCAHGCEWMLQTATCTIYHVCCRHATTWYAVLQLLHTDSELRSGTSHCIMWPRSALSLHTQRMAVERALVNLSLCSFRLKGLAAPPALLAGVPACLNVRMKAPCQRGAFSNNTWTEEYI